MMKNIKNIKYLVLVLALIISASCSQWIDEDINIDPDSPADVPMNLLLPPIQQSMGYNLLGNNTVRVTNIWTQQFDGVDRQSFTTARYQLTSSSTNNLWFSLYAEIFENSVILINKAIDQESPQVRGVAEVLVATTLGISTDLFGDMPFSQALKGDQNILSPEYDSQQKIYDTLFTILDRAIVNLKNSNNAISISGDVIYDGDTDKWIKAANSIKARHALQLSGVNGNAAYTQALAYAANGFTSNSDDYLVPFEDANENPIFQFMEDRTDIRMCSTFVNMLADNDDDPRLPFYAAQDGDGNYTGSDPGSENPSASWPGTYNASTDSSTILMSYTELKFIEAECRFMLSLSGAQEAYEEAVAASVLRVTGSANTAWLDANINGVPVTLEGIIVQKYIANYSTNQPYADYRRTGFPVLTISTGAVLPAIPTRFPYPQSELDFNTANTPFVIISDKLWWDQ